MVSNGEIQDYRMEKSIWSVGSLKHLANEQMLPKPRSLAWAILLKILPPLDQPIEKFHTSLRSYRDSYEQLNRELSTDPRYVVDDDPLSQHDGSAWRQHFCDNELKALILQDVVRTFPDEPYFRDTNVQDLMVRVLFLWSRQHPEIGYRQGMHEILAILLYELHLDRVHVPAETCDILRYYLEAKYLEHDSYMLLSGVMAGIQRFYSTGDVVPAPNGRLPSLSETMHTPNEVVRYLEHVRENYLVPLDPELAKHLNDCNVKLEFFGIRWLRLLFGREFPRSEVSLLWGYIFSEGPTMPHLHYVVVAMLIAVRRTLLRQFGCGVLSALMRDCVSRATIVLRVARLLATRDHTQPLQLPGELAISDNDSSSSESWTVTSERELLTLPSTVPPASRLINDDADIARALGTLAVLRARLPAAAAALADTLPAHPAHPALTDILQLARLVECRNHSFIDVEPALEAAEGQPAEPAGGTRLVPVAETTVNRHQQKPAYKTKRIKEVPLRLFSQVECAPHNGLPSLDPLHLRTD